MNALRLLVLVSLVACATDPGTGVPGDDAPIDPDGDSFKSCPGSSPVHETFNAFWKALDEEYALFDLRLQGTTWGAVGAAGCKKVSSDLTPLELYDVLINMARKLDDGHTTLTAPALGRDEDAEVTVYPHYDAVDSLEDLVETKYLVAPYKRAAEDEISWGSIGNIGFISITSMDGLSATGDDADDVAAAKAGMTAAIADLKSRAAIIIDVRANTGGWDTVALEIASWFGGARTVAWNEQVRNGPGHTDFSAPVPTYVEAMQPAGFAKPVIVLTSGGTFSAGETFLLAMRVRDNVTLLGEISAGHFSDVFEDELPNGWTFTYSGERYIAADGMNYETLGVPVDVPLDLDLAALAAGRDNQLEAALARLQ